MRHVSIGQLHKLSHACIADDSSFVVELSLGDIEVCRMDGSASLAASQLIKNSLINTSVIETVAHMIQQFVRTRKPIMVIHSSVQAVHLISLD